MSLGPVLSLALTGLAKAAAGTDDFAECVADVLVITVMGNLRENLRVNVEAKNRRGKEQERQHEKELKREEITEAVDKRRIL